MYQIYQNNVPFGPQFPAIPGVPVPEGTYYVIGTNIQTGCHSFMSGTLTISKIPVPAAPTCSNNGPVCNGGTLLLAAAGAPNATFFWSDPNGNNYTTVLPVFTVPAPADMTMNGVWTVTQTVNGCTGAPCSTTVTVNPVPTRLEILSTTPTPIRSGMTFQVVVQSQGLTGDSFGPMNACCPITVDLSQLNGMGTFLQGGGIIASGSNTVSISATYTFSSTYTDCSECIWLTASGTQTPCSPFTISSPTYPPYIVCIYQSPGSPTITWGLVTRSEITVNWNTGLKGACTPEEAGIYYLLICKNTSGPTKGDIFKSTEYPTNGIVYSTFGVPSYHGSPLHRYGDLGYTTDFAPTPLLKQTFGVYEGQGQSVTVINLLVNNRYRFWVIPFVYVTPTEVVFFTADQSTQRSRYTAPRDGNIDAESITNNTELNMSSITPNPASDKISFNVILASPQNVNISVYDMAGRLMSSPVVNAPYAEGSYPVDVNLDKLMNGTYSVVITAGNEVIVERFVVNK
jgi:hypothetical protein